MVKILDAQFSLSLKRVVLAVKLRSSFGRISDSPEARAGNARIYRIRSWPDLPASLQKAGVFQILSVMSTRSVTGRWIRIRAKMSHMSGKQTQELIDLLGAHHGVETESVNSEIH